MIIELLETFENNDSYFSMGYGDRSQDGFTKQLISFSQLQPMLDDAIGKIDPLIETKNLLRVFTQNSEIWMKKQELKLKGVISSYVLDKFESIFSQSLESFLRKNLHMENAPAQIFANAIQHQIIAPLVASAAPIFWTSEPMVQNRLETAHRLILTVPNAANCICQAADNYKGEYNTIAIRKSLINDRISVLKTISGVPMHAYQGLLLYFDIYDKGEKQRIHSYEGNSNWRENLTFPCPYSYLPQYTKNAEELLKLYKRAEKMGIIYYDGSQAYVKRSVEVPKEALEIDSLIKNGKLDQVKANDRIQELQELLTEMLEPLRINSKGNSSKNNPNNPDPADHANTLVKDNFLRFYGIQQAVKAEVEKYDQIHHTLESIEQIKEKEKLRKIFFDAVVAEMFEADEISKHYLEFQKVWESDLAKRQEFCQKTNVKFNEILIKEKLNRVEQLSSMYATESIEKVSKKEEFEDMENFCLAFKDYLSQMQLMLNMVDLT